MIRLFVIEDHFLIVSGLKNSFRSGKEGIRIIGSATNVRDAVEQLKLINTDIIILDLFIKDDSPIENIRTIIASYPLIPIVILTVETSVAWKKKMFREGAKAYLD